MDEMFPKWDTDFDQVSPGPSRSKVEGEEEEEEEGGAPPLNKQKRINMLYENNNNGPVETTTITSASHQRPIGASTEHLTLKTFQSTNKKSLPN